MSCLHKHKLTLLFPCQINVPDLLNHRPGLCSAGALRSRGIQMGHGNEGWAWTSHSEEKVWGQSQRGTTMTQ